MFWLNDLSVLYRNEKYLEFVPTKGMSEIDILNSLTRLCIYSFLLMSALNYSYQHLSIPLIGIIFIIFIYILHVRDSETFKNSKVGDYDKENAENNQENLNSPEQQKSYEDHKKFIENICRRPTKNNPFMNVLVSDYNNDNDPISCNPKMKDVKEQTERTFQDNLFRSVDDVWDRENSQRQFYTMPIITVPNQQKEFAEWLYKTPYSCKSDQMYCLQYEDLRYKR
jgi:hypothetical protein